MDRAPCLALALLLPAALATACSDGADAGGGPRRAASRVPVRAAAVTAREVVYSVKALGSLEPAELVQVTAEVSGVVKDVLFEAGDAVTPRTVIARIDPQRYRLEAERAEAVHLKAVAEWKRAESERDRREALARQELLAPEELTRARLQAEGLAADAASAKAARDLARQNEARSSVRPERAGEINTRTVDPGQFVQVGAVLATLVDPSRLRLRFKTSQGESLHAREGQRVTFRVTSVAGGGHGTAAGGEPAGAQHTARVYHVGDVADPSTRQVEVLAWVDDPGTLKPGFFAEVTLATGTHPGALVVPESAVLASERGFVVYVIRDGRAQERLVTVGLRTGDGSVEIASGLQGGESIVVEGSDRLSHGIAVEVVKDEPAAAGQRG